MKTTYAITTLKDELKSEKENLLYVNEQLKFHKKLENKEWIIFYRKEINSIQKILIL